MTTEAIKLSAREHIAPLAQALLFALIGVLLFTLVDGAAFADIKAAVTNVQVQAQGLIQPLGTIAIITLGIAAMFGRITWTQALVVAIGIVLAATAAEVYGSITR